MAPFAQRLRELRMTLGHPKQRSHRIAQRRRLQQGSQVFQQRGIGLRQRRSSAAGAPNLRGRGIARLQVLQASIDRAARYPCRPRHHGHAAISGRPRLRGAEQPPASFVEARAQRFETAANRCLVNHALVIDCAAETGKPPPPSKGGRPLHQSIHLFCGVALPDLDPRRAAASRRL